MISCRFAKGGIDMERNWLDITALILIIIGAINWGLIGFFEFDLISYFFVLQKKKKFDLLLEGKAVVCGAHQTLGISVF